MLDTDEGRARRGALLKQQVWNTVTAPENRANLPPVEKIGASQVDVARAVQVGANVLCCAARNCGGKVAPVSPSPSFQDNILAAWSGFESLQLENEIPAWLMEFAHNKYEETLDQIANFVVLVNGLYILRQKGVFPLT